MRESVRFLGLMIVAACVACDAGPRVAGVSHRGVIQLRRESSTFAAAVPAAFVSVADSIAIAVTRVGGARVATLERRLSRREANVELTLDLDDGDYRVDATVTSAVDTVLFLGTAAFRVNKGAFAVNLTLAPRKPVLLVAPDTVVVTVPNANTLGTDTLRIYNRGVDSLSWSAVSVTCPPRVTCLIPSPVSGKLQRDGSVLMTLSSVRMLTAPVTLVLSSVEGQVPVVVRTVVAP